MKFLSRLLTYIACAAFLVQAAEASVIPSIPYNLTNGTLADATQVMGNFNTIVTDVNANAAIAGINTNITSLTGITTPLANTYGGTAVYTGGTSTGSANAQVVSAFTPTNFALTAGNVITFIAGFDNTAAMTLNPNGIGATTVEKTGSSGLIPLTGGEVQAGGSYAAIVSGSVLVILNPTLGFDGTTFALNSSTGNLEFGSTPTLPTTTLASNQTAFLSGLSSASNLVATTYYVNNQTSIRGHQLISATGTGNFVAPAGTAANTLFKVTLTGGGAAGGADASGYGAAGGGAGATAIVYVSGLVSGTSYPYTIGTGGAGVLNSSGGPGVLSSMVFVSGTTITAPGGSAPQYVDFASGGQGGVTPTNGSINIPGGDGSVGNGGGTLINNGGNGGSSFWGGGGSGGAGTNPPASPARVYGAGGGGSGATTTGGSGMQGVLSVEWQ